MTSSWRTYSPNLPSTDVESSELDTPPVTRVSLHKDHRDLSHNMHTAPSELVKPDPKLACTEVPSLHGRVGSNSSANRVVPLTSTDGYPTTIIDKAAPVVVSATSIRVKFREDVSPTLPLDVPDSPGVRHTPASNGHFSGAPEVTRGLARSTEPLATQELSSMSDPLTCDPDSSSQRITTSSRADNSVRLTSPKHKHVVGHSSSLLGVGDATAPSAESRECIGTSPESSSPPERHVRTSAPAAICQGVAPVPPISGASDVAPPAPPISTESRPISTAGTSSPRSPSIFTSVPVMGSLTLAPNPDIERSRSSRQTPKRTKSVGSGSIAQTKYTDMVFENVPLFDNILATFFTWLVLAGFIVLPNTFTTLEAIGDTANANVGTVGKVLRAARNLPLLYIGYGCCGVGGIGMCVLWWRWSHNYVWLLGSIFIPGMMSGVSGVISTLAGIYGTQNGSYSTTSIVTLTVTGGCMVVCGALSLLYMFWKLRVVKVDHDRRTKEYETREVGDEIGEK